MLRRFSGSSTKWVILFLAAPILIYFGFAIAGKTLEIYRLKQGEARIEQDIEGMKAYNEALRQQKGYLESDTYIEKMAREELNLVKPGETAVIVIPPPEPTPTAEKPSTPVAKSETSERRNWWDFLLDRLRGS